MFARSQALATDYDETIAHEGVVGAPVVAALERFRASGRKLILDTGRELEDLLGLFPHIHLFDWVVAENGAVLYHPATGKERSLSPPPSPALLRALRRHRVPLIHGRVVLETSAIYRRQIDASIQETNSDAHLEFNKSTILILPNGINKASGLAIALEELGIAREDTVGIGDAENDRALLAYCGVAVAVPHAVPSIIEKADAVLGPIELIDRILTPNGEPALDRPSSRGGQEDNPPLPRR